MPEVTREYGADGALLGSVELDTDIVRRRDAAGQLVSERPPTPTELASLAAVGQRNNHDTLRALAAAALAGNRTFLAVASPTTAQVVAQVRALTRQNTALIRLQLGQLDGTD